MARFEIDSDVAELEEDSKELQRLVQYARLFSDAAASVQAKIAAYGGNYTAVATALGILYDNAVSSARASEFNTDLVAVLGALDGVSENWTDLKVNPGW